MSLIRFTMSKRIILILIIFLSTFFSQLVAKDNAVDIGLTHEEKKWINNNIVKIGVDQWTPILFLNNKNKIDGIVGDYLKLLTKKTGIQYEIVNDSWDKLLQKLKTKEIDVLPNAYYSEDRAKYGLFSKPYFKVKDMIYINSSNKSIKSFENLANKKLAIVKGYATIEKIKKKFPQINIIETKNLDDSIKRVINKEVDALYDGQLVLEHLIQDRLILNLKMVAQDDIKSENLHLFFNTEQVVLKSIMQKALDSITYNEHKQIRLKWLSNYKEKQNRITIVITEKEKNWIKNNPTIKVANEMDWAPLDYNEFGKPKGLSIEFIELLAKKLGINIEFVKDHTWSELVSLFKNKEIDVLPAFYKNKERENFTLFTQPYYKGKMGIFSRKDDVSINNSKDLDTKKIGIQTSDATIIIAKTQLPNSKFIEIDTNDELVIALATGKIDAIIGNPILFNYYAKEAQVSNIKLIDYVPMTKKEQLDISLHIGIDKDKPILHALLEKAMKHTTREEFNVLENKWMMTSNATKKENKSRKVKLSKEEEHWINIHTVKIGVEPWAPIIYSRNGKDTDGITGDILKLMIQNSGLKTEVITDFWDPLLEAFKNKEIDLLPATYFTEERATYGLYSKPYYKMLDYIYVKDNNQNIHSLKDLNGKKLAIIKGFGTIPKIQKKFPMIEIVETKDLSDSIIKLLKGDVDALYEGQIAVEYKIREDLITGIKGIPQSDFEAAPLHFFSKIDEPLLQSILQKSFDSIPLEEIKKIKSKWVDISSKNKIVDIDAEEEGIPWFLLITISSFLLILTISLIVIRFLPDELIAKYFGSKYFKISTLLGMSIIVVLILLLAFHTLEKNKKAIVSTIDTNLHFLLNMTKNRLDSWVHDRKNYLLQLGRDPKLVKLAQELNGINQNKTTLINSNAQKEIRNFFDKRKNEFGDLGFFIINKNSISLASKRDTNIGSKNVIAKYKPELLRNVFEGKAEFIPPIPSDVELTTNKILGENDRKQMTMFFAVPIQDEDGNVLSVLTQRLKVEGELSDIIQSGYMGESGESYIFNKDGFMLSKSRFREQLHKMGLLNPGEKEYEKLVIRDPGKNLLNNAQSYSDVSKQSLTYMAENAISLSKGLIHKYSEVNSNTKGYRDYRGVRVYGAWIWSKDLDFGITAEINEEEAIKGFYILRQNLLVITGLTLFLTIISTIILIVLGEKATRSVLKANDELNKLLYSFDENVIASRSDLKGNITYASKAFALISGYSVEELIGKPHSIVRHPDTKKELFKDLWKTIQSGKIWRGQVKNRKKNSGIYWVEIVITPEFDKKKNIIGYSAIRQDITSKKEVEDLSASLEQKVEERTLKLKESEERFELTVAGSGDGLWEYDYIEDNLWWSPRFIEMLGYEENEIEVNLDTYFSHIHKNDVEKQSNAYQEHLKTNCTYDNTYRTRKKDGSYFWTRVRGKTLRDESGKALKTSGSVVDVTELQNQKKQTESILTSIMLPMLITSKESRKIVYANTFAENQYETSKEEIIGLSIDVLYTYENQKKDILNEMREKGKIKNYETKFKTLKDNHFDALLSLVEIKFNDEDCFLGVASDITEQKNRELLVKELHKNTSDSIEYASLIQHSLIPSHKLYRKYFDDYFTIWHPKDVVGGDIYLFEELRNEEECLLMVIDCTGHGVPGAFVTMLVKAIERQVIATIANDKTREVSPAWILQYFNKTMKKLLRQEDDESISNAGFDGGIFYYNKKENIVKFAGAETPLFYMQDNELKTIKGDRQSIGYKKSDVNFEFTDHIIPTKEGMHFYISTDGYFDQNGGEKGFPFNKKRFKGLIEEYHEESMADQQEVFLYSLADYQGNEETNDDVTVVGLKI